MIKTLIETLTWLASNRRGAVWLSVAAGAIVVLGGVYWAVSSYLSDSARDKIDVALADLAPLAAVSYGDVSVSPIFFTTTINDIVVQPPSGGALEIEQALIRSIDTEGSIPKWLDVRLKFRAGAFREAVKVADQEAWVSALDSEATIDLSWALSGGKLEASLTTALDGVGSISASATMLNVRTSLTQLPTFDANGLAALAQDAGRVLVKKLAVRIEDVEFRKTFLTEVAKRNNQTISQAAGQMLNAIKSEPGGGQQAKNMREAVLKWYLEGGRLDFSWSPRPAMPLALVANQEAFRQRVESGAEIEHSGSSRFDDPESWVNAALHYAVLEGSSDKAREFLELGAAADATHEGLNLLTLAAEKDRPDLVLLLLKKGVQADAKNADGTTALERASWLRNSNFAAWGRTIDVLKAAGAKQSPAEAEYKPAAPFKAAVHDAKTVAEECPNETNDNDISDSMFVPSVDGRQVAYYRIVGGHMGVGQVFVQSLDNRTPARLLYVECSGAYVVAPVRLSEAALLVHDYNHRVLVKVDVKTGHLTLLQKVDNFMLSRDGKQIAYVGGALNDAICSLSILETTTYKIRSGPEVTCGSAIRGWSPDQNTVVYTAEGEPDTSVRNGKIGSCDATTAKGANSQWRRATCTRLNEYDFGSSKARYVASTLIESED